MRFPAPLTATLLLVALPAQALEFGPSHDLPMQQNANINLVTESASVGDVNGDGRADVFFFATGFGSSDRSLDFVAYLYEQQADGTMREALRFSMAPGGVARYSNFGSAMGDVDNDGKAELILMEPDGAIAILKRPADGPFEQVARLRGFGLADQLGVEDLDGDGFVEIFAYSSALGLAIHPGRGSLDFGDPVSVQNLHGTHIVLGDTDGDGRRDVINAVMDYDGIGINTAYPPRPGGYTGRGPDRYGYFRAPIHLDRIHADNVGVGRLLGHPDPALFVNTVESEQIAPHVVELWQTMSVYTRAAGGEWQLAVKKRYVDLGATMRASFRVRDLDGDGIDEVIVFHSDRVEILRQKPGGFEDVYVPVDNRPGYANVPRYSGTHLADFNGDGCVDLGYMGRSYTIHYRSDCPTATARPARRAQSVPATPGPRIKPRRGNRLRR